MSYDGRPVAIVGVGNVLMGDEGIGVEIARRLQMMTLPDDVEVIDGGTLGLELAVHLRGKDTIMILDAIALEAEPGSVFRFEIQRGDCFSSVRRSSHDGGLEELFKYLLTLSPTPTITMFGICPAEIGRMRTGISSVLEKNVNHIISRILEELARIRQRHTARLSM